MKIIYHDLYNPGKRTAIDLDGYDCIRIKAERPHGKILPSHYSVIAEKCTAPRRDPIIIFPFKSFDSAQALARDIHLQRNKSAATFDLFLWLRNWDKLKG